MNGYSFFMILVMVWLFLRLSCAVIPRRGACVYLWRRFAWITGWVCFDEVKARRKLN